MSGALPEHIDDIEAFYKDNLQNLEVPPSMDLWDRIDAALPAQKAVPEVQKPSSSSFNSTLWWGGAGIGLVGVALAVYWATHSPSHTTQDPQKEIKRSDSSSLAKPIPQKDAVSAPTPMSVDVTPAKDQKENNKVLDKPNDDVGPTIPSSAPDNANTAVEPSKPEPVQPVSTQKSIDTAIVEQKPEAPTNNAPAKKTMQEKLKEKNGNKSNDLFIKKKD